MPRSFPSPKAASSLDTEKRPVDSIHDPVAKCIEIPDRTAQFRHWNVGDGWHQQDEVASCDLDDRHQSAACWSKLFLRCKKRDNAIVAPGRDICLKENDVWKCSAGADKRIWENVKL